MHKLVLNASLETDFKLIGINTSLEPFKMAFLINKNLKMQFSRTSDDAELVYRGFNVYFALYRFCDPKTECNLYFIQNKSKYIDENPKFVSSLFGNQNQTVGKFLIDSHKQCDYFIKIEDEFDRFKTKKLLLDLNEIPQIISTYEIASDNIKCPENLIFE